MSSILKQRLETFAEKLELLRCADCSHQLFGATRHGYGLRPPISTQQLRRIELECSIQFPEAYFAFLNQLGNGGAGPGYGLLSVGEALQKSCEREFATSFTHAATWCPLFGGGGPEELEIWENWYFSHRHVDGSLFVSDDGCGYQVLLVLTGPERGNMWEDGRVSDSGIYPLSDNGLRLNFLDWYERWLNQSIGHLKELK